MQLQLADSCSKIPAMLLQALLACNDSEEVQEIAEAVGQRVSEHLEGVGLACMLLGKLSELKYLAVRNQLGFVYDDVDNR